MATVRDAPQRQQKVSDPQTDRALRLLREDVRAALRLPDVRGQAVASVYCPGVGTVRVAHGLGKVPAGWRVTRATGGQPALYQVEADDRHLTLASSAACTVDLWVWP